jgi:hydrogenase maturation factor
MVGLAQGASRTRRVIMVATPLVPQHLIEVHGAVVLCPLSQRVVLNIINTLVYQSLEYTYRIPQVAASFIIVNVVATVISGIVWLVDGLVALPLQIPTNRRRTLIWYGNRDNPSLSPH